MTVWRHFYENVHGDKVAGPALHIANHAAHITAHAAANPSHLFFDKTELIDNYREGFHISADNSRCDPPPDDHGTEKVRMRRAEIYGWVEHQVWGWQPRAAFAWHDEVSRLSSSAFVGRTPSRYVLWLGLAQVTVAVALDDGLLLNDSVWGAMQSTTKATARWFADTANHTRWIEKWADTLNFRKWHYVEERDGALLTAPSLLTAGGGSSDPLVTSAQIAKGRAEAENYIRGRA